jgi:sn-1 stearoyl-lipid 9-desaturase
MRRLPVPRRQINYVNAGALVAMHVASVGAFWCFTVEGLVCFLVMVTLALNLGLIVCFHRLLSHRSFTLPRWLELSLAFFGTCAAEAGPVTWVALHRKHHAFADRPGDPHSPSIGSWWSYVGWTYHRFDIDVRVWAKDVYRDPAYRWLERWSTVIVLGVAVWLSLVGYLLGGQRLALSFLFWGFFVRIVYTWHTSFLVNFRAHAARAASSTASAGRSRDVWWLAVMAFGDGWHNTHHRQPQSARHGHPWYRVDPAWLTIRGLESLGLATDVKRSRPSRTLEPSSRIWIGAEPLTEGSSGGRVGIMGKSTQ